MQRASLVDTACSLKHNRIRNLYSNQHNALIYYFILRFYVTCFGLTYSPSSRGYVYNVANGNCLRNLASYMLGRLHRYPPNTPFYIFFQQLYVLNFLNMLHTLRFYLFKM
jgi:hypothetical protein